MKLRDYSGKITYLLAGLSLLAFAAIIPMTTRAHDQEADQHQESFTVWAALDLDTVKQNSINPSQPPMTFARGDSLVVDGNLYSSGDGMAGMTAGNDPNAPGAIGKIRCRATFIVDSTDMAAPYASFVSELYSLPDDMTNILADGLGPNFGVTARRIVSGGTGRFRYMVGEIEETDIGFNKTGGCNLRVTFKLRKVEREHHDH